MAKTYNVIAVRSHNSNVEQTFEVLDNEVWEEEIFNKYFPENDSLNFEYLFGEILYDLETKGIFKYGDIITPLRERTIKEFFESNSYKIILVIRNHEESQKTIFIRKWQYPVDEFLYDLFDLLDY